MGKNLPAMQETQVLSLGQEDSLTPVLSGEVCGQRSLVGHSPWVHQESDMTEQLNFHFSNINAWLPASPTTTNFLTCTG